MVSHLSRRLVVVYVAAALFIPALAVAAPEGVRLSVMGEGSTTIGVAWSTITGTAEATVKYGTVKGTYSNVVTGTTTLVTASVGSVSEVVLKNLKPSTTYYYRAGGTKGGFSQEHSFTTAPPAHKLCGKVRFAVAGDSRAESWEGNKGASINWVNLLKQIVPKKPHVILHTGDIVYDGTKDKQWAHHLKVTGPTSAQVPVMYAIGNHDDGPGEGLTAHYNKVMLHPVAQMTMGGSGTEDYYYFTMGNAIFVSLSTTTFSGGTIKFQKQADWLDKVLTQNPRRWKVVFYHHPVYTVNLFLNHPPNEQKQNAALVPVFNKHHVDLAFQGHNHYYERYLPSNCKNGGSNTACPVSSADKGTIYVTAGGGGALVLPFVGFPNPKVRPAAFGAFHYVLVDLDDHKMTLQTYGIGGKLLDSTKVTKTNSGPDPCLAPQLDAGTPDAASGDAAVADALPTQDAWPGNDSQPGSDQGGTGSDITVSNDSTAGTPDSAGKPDAGPVLIKDDGCSCRAGQGRLTGATTLLLAALALLLLRRRRDPGTGRRS